MLVVDYGGYPIERLYVGGGETVERREAILSSGLKAWTLGARLCGFESWLDSLLPRYPG